MQSESTFKKIVLPFLLPSCMALTLMASMATYCSNPEQPPLELTAKKTPAIKRGKANKTCPTCNLVMTNNFAQHVKTHTKQKNHICSFCPRAFARSTTKRAHEQLHTRKTFLRCLCCKKIFPETTTHSCLPKS